MPFETLSELNSSGQPEKTPTSFRPEAIKYIKPSRKKVKEGDIAQLGNTIVHFDSRVTYGGRKPDSTPDLSFTETKLSVSETVQDLLKRFPFLVEATQYGIAEGHDLGPMYFNPEKVEMIVPRDGFVKLRFTDGTELAVRSAAL